MKKNVKTKLFGAVFLILNSSTVIADSKPDWTPFLKSWEHGCGDTKEWHDFTRNTTRQENEDVFIGNIVLPEEYMDAVEGIELTSDDTESGVIKTTTIPVAKGSYYGIPVKSFQMIFTPNSGFSIEYVIFDSTFEEVKMRLSDVDYDLNP